jgi:hypothetical protein
LFSPTPDISHVPTRNPTLKWTLDKIWPLKNPKARIATGKIEQDRALAMKMLFDAVKRENVVLQLEVCLQRSARQSFFWGIFIFLIFVFHLLKWEPQKPPKNRRTCCQTQGFGHHESWHHVGFGWRDRRRVWIVSFSPAFELSHR